jgi:hypothetical protein
MTPPPPLSSLSDPPDAHPLALEQQSHAVRPLFQLSNEQIQTFLQDGLLVVEDVLSQQEVLESIQGLHQTLRSHGVDVSILLKGTGNKDSTNTNNNNHNEEEGQQQQQQPDDHNHHEKVQLQEQAKAFAQLSTTNGSGGVLDLFYDDWKLKIATNPTLFAMTTQLWKAAYNTTTTTTNNNNGGQESEPGSCNTQDDPETTIPANEEDKRGFQWHPYGPFDCHRGYLYMDRIGYRLPTQTCELLGQLLYQAQQQQPAASSNLLVTMTKKKKKALALQRSLTPHLDCCPDRLFHDKANKWRPIQCMISLTENLEPNTGGFEAAKGFHQTFDQWAKTRSQPPLPTPLLLPPTTLKDGNNPQSSTVLSLCVGEYTHIRPQQDRDVLQQICHVPVKAGSAIFWDNRIPHANSYRHDGSTARAVVYCSFLPDVPLNQRYVLQQLRDYRQRRSPTGSDQWGRDAEDKNDDRQGALQLGDDGKPASFEYPFTPLGRKLMGLDPW